MPARPAGAGVVVLLAGVLVLFVGVIAQLTTTDGLAEALWVAVSVVGAAMIVAGIVLMTRRFQRLYPPEE